jgi:hypothetical protein
MSSITRTALFLFAAALTAPISPAASQAGEPLLWKFEPGKSNRYRMTQNMEMGMNVGGNDVSNNINQVIDMNWKVRELKDDGSAVLEQKIDRMKMTIDAGGNKIEIDSASEEEPQNQAAMLAPLLKAFTSEPFEVTMSPRGEIKDVVVSEKMLEALKNAPGAAVMGDMATAEGFKKMVSQAAFALPEKLEPNTEWTQKMEMKLPSVGTQIAETTYKYQGPKEVDGQQYEAFAPSLKVSYQGGETPVEIANQESKGEILFNREAGRLERSELKQDMTLKMTASGQQIEQTLKQTIEMKWLPEDAE